MPISTLCAKSMPSTYSRKPCTKCWRDCSPSLTTSIPASSWSLSASSVASSLAASRSAPDSFHGAHSLFGSASQAGFGRLPATVVSNTRSSLTSCLVRCAFSSTLGIRSAADLKSINPIEALQQPLPTDRAHREIAQWRLEPAHLVELAVLARGVLRLGHARHAPALVAPHCRRRVVWRAAEAFGQHGGIFDRHRR